VEIRKKLSIARATPPPIFLKYHIGPKILQKAVVVRTLMSKSSIISDDKNIGLPNTMAFV
jgi:hypothetical protein